MQRIFQFGNGSQSRQGAAGKHLRFASVVCLLLLVIFMAVQVGHAHSFASDPDHCPICVVMQSAAPVAVAVLLLLFTACADERRVFATAPIARAWHYELFNRPPPRF